MNSFGRLFKVSLFGESHGEKIGIVVDGVRPGILLSVSDFHNDLERRKPGKAGTTARTEADEVQIASGVYRGHTTGAPLTMLFKNTNTRPADYEQFVQQPRPGHADFVSEIKYQGFSDPRGGGHFSGRMTVALVAAGVVAKKMIQPVIVQSTILEIGGLKEYDKLLESLQLTGDSVGGLVECKIQNVPVGWGEPFFDSMESIISHLVFSIPSIKGIEFGSGFKASVMKGSEHNDPIVDESGKTKTNHSGGINAGISNGNEIVFRVAVKPTSSISSMQETFNFNTGKSEQLVISGRHDTCIALRVPVVLEAVTAIGLADLSLISGW
jgi:chorismate synthase